ncbi:ABC transporter substrate-binding protein [Corticibacter populi]|uniref:ABC transporter substrate-binding protein n=1 Tax=Corticibacter populi TaxID=1550736 RepID=A0A3M6R0M5_9BURK|nr:ABC transporter substrate-binding protein [Corticibacter populi]RMX08798.1 ABC transporter substrate-binding protein [Corticibacter populi]RZS30103.1 amino acid/amide ABC transporter substrate-binding protein (HAAT family) [Corticibacter populi]
MTMKRKICALVAGVCLAVTAQAQVKVGVVTSSSGPIALVGIPQKNSVDLLPAKAGDLDIQYISLDDASNPTASVTAFKKLIGDGVDAIIGPSGTPNAMGVIQIAAEAQVPMLAPVGSSAVILPLTEQKKWVFKTTQNDDIIASALIDHMASSGVKTLGFVGTADPFGESWLNVTRELAEKAGIKVVAAERFQRQDTSLTAQSIKLIAARPDAILVAAPGSSSVLPQTTLVDQKYPGQIYQTHGAALNDFLKLGGKKVEGTILAASLMLVMDEVPDSHPSKTVARKYIDDYKTKYGSEPATFGANVYDAGLLLQAAIPEAAKAGQPGTVAFRQALRDALEQIKDLPATQGVYTMTAEDHSGFDERGRELIVVKDGTWRLLK